VRGEGQRKREEERETKREAEEMKGREMGWYVFGNC